MLYVTTSLRDGSSWGLGARLYMRSLALASQAESLPFRLLWAAPCSTDQGKDGTTIQSYADVLAPSELPKSLQPLRPHFGPGPSPRPASCMLFVGEVVDAVERISQPDECPAKNAVLTSWPASTLPPHLAVRLSAYDLVLVPEGEGQVFRDADVPYVVEVPWPAPTEDERTRSVQRPPKDVERVLCAVGAWGGEDDVERVASAFISGFSRADGVGLLLMCNDIPRQWVSNAVLRSGKGKEQLPFVTALGTYGLWDDPAAVDRALLVSHAFVDVSRRVGASFWARRAASLGCPTVAAFSATLTNYGGVGLWPGASPAQSWRDALSPVELTGLLRTSTRTTRPVPLGADPASAGRFIARLIKRLVAGEQFAGQHEAAPVRAVERQDRIGAVVPFGGGDLAGLRRCLTALLEARREQDALVVAVRGAPEEARALCGELHVPCVHSTSGGERWNMSAARNAGWRALLGSCDLVAFVDADVVVPRDYLQRLAREAYKRPGMVLTPYVVDEGGDVSTARIASGMSAYPIAALAAARGFDEAYRGWGHEDIDLLHRLREVHETAAVLLPNLPPASHTPHPPRAGEEQQRDHEANLARYEDVARRLDSGERVEVNAGEWGAFTRLE